MALVTRKVLLSLFVGILMGELIISNFYFFNTLFSLYDRFIYIMTQGWILKTFAFALLVGSVMNLINRSGGVDGFIEQLTMKYRVVKSQRGALLLTYAVGVVIFIESSITSLIAGAVGRPLCDKYGVSRAKLAFVCDSTSAPICSILLFNGWGALLLGLITAQINVGLIHGESVAILMESVIYNFYAFFALLVTLSTILFNVDFGFNRVTKTDQYIEFHEDRSGNMWMMILPIIVMVVSVFIVLFITGDGEILKGSGSTSIFYSQVITLLFMLILYKVRDVLSIKEWFLGVTQGAYTMFPIVLILLFAFMIGNVTSVMKTGEYLASYANDILNPAYLAAIIFLISSIMAFSTGTSWGTYSIMVPIAIPLAVGLDVDIAIVIGAVISGGVFGDHSSPISDTTIISSMAAGCETIEHVKTQLPYALISAILALITFVIFGYMK